MTIQAEFDIPEAVGRRDEILLRFLRNDFITSLDDEVWMQYGREVRVPIFLQIESEEEDSLDRLARVFFGLSIFLVTVLVI